MPSKLLTANNILTHNQPYKNKATLSKRALLYNVNYATIGENCLYVPYSIPFKIKNKLYIIRTYNQLAEALFLNWKNSPAHYKNITNYLFVWSGFYIGYNTTSNKLYATNDLAKMQTDN